MATLAHVAAGLVIGRVHAQAATGASRLASFVVFTGVAVLPDLDIVLSDSRVGGGSVLAHRGISHSLGMAIAVGTVVWLLLRRFASRWPPLRTALAAGIAMASNGLLDIFSAGGEGVTLLWPLVDARLQSVWRPIPDAPVESLLTTVRGIRCLLLESAGCLPAFAWALSRRAPMARSSHVALQVIRDSWGTKER